MKSNMETHSISAFSHLLMAYKFVSHFSGKKFNGIKHRQVRHKYLIVHGYQLSFSHFSFHSIKLYNLEKNHYKCNVEILPSNSVKDK